MACGAGSAGRKQKVALGRSIISTDLHRLVYQGDGDDAAHPAKIDCDVL